MALRQSLLHQALCVLRGPALSNLDDQGRCRELHLDWKTVKDLDKEYMQEQLRRAGTPAPPASCPYGLSTTDRSNPGLYVNRGITLLLSC